MKFGSVDSGAREAGVVVRNKCFAIVLGFGWALAMGGVLVSAEPATPPRTAPADTVESLEAKCRSLAQDKLAALKAKDYNVVLILTREEKTVQEALRQLRGGTAPEAGTPAPTMGKSDYVHQALKNAAEAVARAGGEAQRQVSTEARLPRPAYPDRLGSALEIKSLYQAEYAKTGKADVLALARELNKQALSNSNTPLQKYTLLLEAGRLAVLAKEYDYATENLHMLFSLFQLDPAVVLVDFAQSISSDRLATMFSDTYVGWLLLSTAKDTYARGEFTLAQTVIPQLQTAVKKANDPLLNQCTNKFMTQVERLNKDWEALAPARARLKTAPDEPAVNLSLAQFYLWKRADFRTALPYMAKSGDAELVNLASLELALVAAARPPAAAVPTEVKEGIFENNPKAEAPTAETPAIAPPVNQVTRATVACATAWWDFGAKLTALNKQIAWHRAMAYFRSLSEADQGNDAELIKKYLADYDAAIVSEKWQPLAEVIPFLPPETVASPK